MDYAIWHLDGPEEIKFLDYILPHVDGVQWVPGLKPGVPQDGEDEWMPLYKKIQKSGTNNVLLTLNNALVPEVYEKLGPEGTFVYSLYLTRGLADCYLPKFAGGNGGEYVKNISEWAKAKGLKKVSRADIRQYASESNIEIEKSLVSQLFSELRKKTKGFSYIQDVEKVQL